MNKNGRLCLFFAALLVIMAGCGPDPFFIPVTSIEGVPTTGTTKQPLILTGRVKPGFASKTTIVWTVTNPGNAKASIVERNTLHANTDGTVHIQARIAGGAAGGKDYIEDFRIEFSEGSGSDPGSTIPVTGVSLDYFSYTLSSVGKTITLTPTITPPNATNRNVTWESSDNAVATVDTVDNNGKVTAKAAGIARITVTTVNGFTATCEVTVTVMPLPFMAKAVTAGSNHTVAIDADGSLWAWGSNSNGQVGNKSTADCKSPVQIGTAADKWKQVSAGDNHTVAIDTNNKRWVWGSNSNGQLGNGSSGANAEKNEPSQIGDNKNWKLVSAGKDHTVAIDTDNKLLTWGANGSGQLGNNSNTGSNSPVPIRNDKNWVQVSAGNNHTVAIDTNAKLWTWGSNSNGQLGNGNSGANEDSKIPVSIEADKNWVWVSAGNNYTVAIDGSDRLWAWGSNSSGKLGLGNITADPEKPTLIGDTDKWLQVSAGNNHTVGIKTDGSLWAWGSNSSGQLGNNNSSGTTSQLNVPTQIGTDKNWAQVSAGNNYTIAIKTDGTLWAWGANNNGQLGDGTTSQRNTPTQVMR